MKKVDVIQQILGNKQSNPAVNHSVETFASTNIALCKYWGKRDQELNLPVTGSFSISMGDLGSRTRLQVIDTENDVVIHNGETLDLNSQFCKRLFEFLNLFRVNTKFRLLITIHTNIPIAAGIASSASGFACFVKALNLLFRWDLKDHELSILARLGSGSASRSIFSGFVEWHVGTRDDGMDCYSEKYPEEWPDLCIAVHLLSIKEKLIPSRQAMQQTKMTSPFYSAWPPKVNEDLVLIKQAIDKKDFDLLGRIAESDSMSMHATMLSSWPPILYSLPETIQAMHKIWELRRNGLQLYFTQDAGPNLKLLFLAKDAEMVLKQFPNLEVVKPFK